MNHRQKQTAPKQVIAYLRVSTSEQVRDGISLPRQKNLIEAYCSLKNLPKVRFIVDEGVSGFKSNRAGYQQVIDLIQTGEVDILIVHDLARLSRRVRDTLSFVEDVIQKHGVEFVSLREDIDTTTPVGKAFLTINAAFNQLYRDEISYRTKSALDHKKTKSEKTGGVIPFGYSLVGSHKLVPQKGEMETIRNIYQLRKEGYSLREIVSYLFENGVTTKTGNKKWSPKVVRDILERQINQITNDSSLDLTEKDGDLSDVTGALFDTEKFLKPRKKIKANSSCI